MDFDFDSLARASRYKLLTSLVVPRPIALVTTIGAVRMRSPMRLSWITRIRGPAISE